MEDNSVTEGAATGEKRKRRETPANARVELRFALSSVDVDALCALNGDDADVTAKGTLRGAREWLEEACVQGIETLLVEGELEQVEEMGADADGKSVVIGTYYKMPGSLGKALARKRAEHYAAIAEE